MCLCITAAPRASMGAAAHGFGIGPGVRGCSWLRPVSLCARLLFAATRALLRLVDALAARAPVYASR